MPLDYEAIRLENVRRYGTDIGRIGPMLLANRYDDRSHFIYELLQNAEDATRRRDPSSSRPREVRFTLSAAGLRVSHFGRPFDEADVRGICGIAESTKPSELTAIGRFGIGFKAVYAFTAAPEVHSGDEHFAIDSFVWPRAIESAPASAGETAFWFPFREGDATAHDDIAAGLRSIGVRTLLFLREVESISWEVEGQDSGLYLRNKPDFLSPNARIVHILGREPGASDDTEERWLILSREVRSPSGEPASSVEIAFWIGAGDEPNAVRRVTASNLVVYFPTIVPTGCGFLVQGPYRTTPSRDNVPRQDSWNRHLADQTALLLGESLPVLRDLGLLDVESLRSLPLDPAKFGPDAMLAPLFAAAKDALAREALLPAFGGGHVAAANARLARSRELRDLVGREQLGALLGGPDEAAWLSDEITQDRTPELRHYLMRELEVAELDPERFLGLTSKGFLEAQPDEWVRQFYTFLSGQPSLWRYGQLSDKPIVRLEDGTHTAPFAGGRPLAFLPSEQQTGFPTVRSSVCAAPAVRTFLSGLGLTEPDPVDDVIKNVLPRYAPDAPVPTEAGYAGDMARVVSAFQTDSKSRRDRLVAALREHRVVAAVDAGTGARSFARPGDVYIASQRLKDLFAGVPGVLLVDDSLDCLRGEAVREALDACGSERYLAPTPVRTDFSLEERREMRARAGTVSCSGGETVSDATVRGLSRLLDLIGTLPSDEAAARSALLWEALCDLVDRRPGVLSGVYRWMYHSSRHATFPASFVRTLNQAAWIPDACGGLERPEFVVFDSISPAWRAHPLLLNAIGFKPPIIETLAREAGIDPAVLDFLKKLGVTKLEDLRERMGVTEEDEAGTETASGEGEPAVDDEAPTSGEDTADGAAGGDQFDGTQPPGSPPAPRVGESSTSAGAPGLHEAGSGADSDAGSTRLSASGTNGASRGDDRGGGPQAAVGREGPPAQGPGAASAGVRQFISYVAAGPDEEEADPDGLSSDSRLALEERAIAAILAEEPLLERRPHSNKGYDLAEEDPSGDVVRRIEVKAMTGTMMDRPVGMSRAQFECATEHGTKFWLYVVERADDPERRRIVRIQDPAGRSRSFTFDRGWAALDSPAPRPPAAATEDM